MWVKPAGTPMTSRQGQRRLGLLSEIVGRNPPFPGGGPTEDLAEPPATAVLFADLKHCPLLETAGIFIAIKVGHGHIQVLRAVGTGERGCSHFLPVFSDLAHHPRPQPAFASNVIVAPRGGIGEKRFGFWRDQQGPAGGRRRLAFAGFPLQPSGLQDGPSDLWEGPG